LWKEFGKFWRFKKQSSGDSSGGSSEDQNANINVDKEGQAHEVSDGNQDSKSISCYVLAKDLSSFYPYPETLRMTLEVMD
jgi:hypothetical protein